MDIDISILTYYITDNQKRKGDLKNEDNLKNEDDLKHEENLDNIKIT